MAVAPQIWQENVATLGDLADPTSHFEAIDIADELPATLRAMLERMVLVRATEEQIGRAVETGIAKCPCHLAIGQEAAAVGVAQALRSTDRVFGAHRSHAHYLALGSSVHRLLAEVLGKETGASRGMGGSMHLIDTARGLYGTVPIVGATIPIAVGAALAAKMDGGQAIAVSFFGDGATEEGVFHESMNLAAVLEVPVLFVCENNLFSSHLHISLRQPSNSVSRFADAHGMTWRREDGNDVVAVARAARDLVESMRAGQGPRFLELVTYRWRGHVGHREDEDVGVMRHKDVGLWKKRDPIRRLAESMVDAGYMRSGELDEIINSAESYVADCWRRALEDPYPPDTAVLDYVYTNPVKAPASRGDE